MILLGLAAGAVLALCWAERRRPLRPRVDDGWSRTVANTTLAAATAAVSALVDRPLTSALARRADARGQGLLKRLRLPPGVELVLALLALDYALYLWHVALHRVGWLWRAHVVHHSDLELDSTTALRFHAGEIVASVAWRTALVRVAGIGLRPLTLYQRVLFFAVVFHHSNLRLPLGLERLLSRIVVTPRLHGIHHSQVQDETDSNWASVLTLWDRLHGTLRTDVPQGAIAIGLPGYPREMGTGELLALPFGRQPDAWSDAPHRLPLDPARHLPDDGVPAPLARPGGRP